MSESILRFEPGEMSRVIVRCNRCGGESVTALALESHGDGEERGEVPYRCMNCMATLDPEKSLPRTVWFHLAHRINDMLELSRHKDVTVQFEITKKTEQ